MKQIEELKKDLTDIFDEEYAKRYLITPQYTAEKLYEKGYRKQSEVAEEIFAEIDRFIYKVLNDEHYIMGDYKVLNDEHYIMGDMCWDGAELKKKYTEVEK